MAFLIGYLGTPFLLGFLVVHFGMKKQYEKKKGVPMSAAQVVGRTIGIGFAFVCLIILGLIF